MNVQLKYAGAVLGLLSLCACGSADFENQSVSSIDSAPTVKVSKPNIVIIMADDMGWGDTGYNGNNIAQTPNLDAMAKSGTVLDRSYSAAPVCSPTRGSVLTGRHPFRYGVYYANVGSLPQEEITMAEILKESGYKTGFFGKWHLGTLSKDILDSNRGGRAEFADEYSPPWLHGFDEVFSTESKVPTYDPMTKPKNGNTIKWWNAIEDEINATAFGTAYWNESGEKVTENLNGDDTRVIVDRAIPFIEKSAASNSPFLAVIWTHAPHIPVVATKSDRDAIATDDPYTANYYGSIRAMDTQVGRIRQALQKSGVADNTIIWFTSDNGPEHKFKPAPGSNGGLRGTKRSLYEGGIRVPGIIEWPGRIAAGKTLNVPVVTSDILPTILDYANIAYPEQRPIDGESLKSVLNGDAEDRNQAIGFESAQQITYIGSRYKIIHQPKGGMPSDPNLKGSHVKSDKFMGQNTDKALEFELYDLSTDPSETNDISDKYPKIKEEMQIELKHWRQSVAKSISGEDY
jgi:arylsulfatase A-like enzyme